MQEEPIKIEDGVYLTKGSSFFGWRLIFPIKNEDGSINWFNLFTGGSWANVAWTILIVGVLVGSIFLYRHDVNAIKEYYQSICFNLNPFA